MFRPAARIVVTLFLFVTNITVAQNPKEIQQLWKAYREAAHDSSKVIAMRGIFWEYIYSKPDSALITTRLLFKHAPNAGSKKFIADGYNQLGIYHEVTGDADSALHFYSLAVKSYQQSGYKTGVAYTYNNLGLLFRKTGQSSEALQYFFKGLHIFETIKHNRGRALLHGNIGFTYLNNRQTALARAHTLKSLALNKELQNFQGMAVAYNSLGVLYEKGNAPDSAAYYFLASMKLEEQLGRWQPYAYAANNLAGVYNALGRNDSALKLVTRAQEIFEELKEYEGIVVSRLTRVVVLHDQRKNSQVISELKSIEKIISKYRLKNYLPRLYTHYSDTYEAIGDLKHALKYARLYATQMDSSNSEKNRELQLQLEAEYESAKKEKEILELNKKKIQDSLEIARKNVEVKERTAEVKTRTYLMYFFVGGFIIVGVLGFLVFRGYRQKSAANKIISRQKLEVELRQKEMTDSINYARKIQLTLLKGEGYIEKCLRRMKR